MSKPLIFQHGVLNQRDPKPLRYADSTRRYSDSQIRKLGPRISRKCENQAKRNRTETDDWPIGLTICHTAGRFQFLFVRHINGCDSHLPRLVVKKPLKRGPGAAEAAYGILRETVWILWTPWKLVWIALACERKAYMIYRATLSRNSLKARKEKTKVPRSLCPGESLWFECLHGIRLMGLDKNHLDSCTKRKKQRRRYICKYLSKWFGGGAGEGCFEWRKFS
ncbi:hypothetical protein F5884DRAFT_34438 [Xylogone sp. PMI_703]|nr:hypothetical protein F5884DRAFT_34438 [Xylogone sp. PMI_703]